MLVGIDAATNLLFAIGVENDKTETILAALEEMFIRWNINPKAACADSAFFLQGKFHAILEIQKHQAITDGS